MSVIARATALGAAVAADLETFIALRHDLHQHPETAFKETRTAGIVADRLRAWGYDVTEGVGGTGVVGTLRRGNGPASLAIRADMDALPITEATGLPYASRNPGVMHACGHDGHLTILLAAAKAIAEHGELRGALHLVFQPAEEVGAGAAAMVRDRLFDRFKADSIYGLHNWPGLGLGKLAFIGGPAMASVDKAIVTIRGSGGHGAAPHETIDPIVAAAHVVTALQTVVARNVDPQDMAVVTVVAIHGGGTMSNVIPDDVRMLLTIRSFRPDIRDQLQDRVTALITAQAGAFGAEAEIGYRRGLAAVVNDAAETAFARDVAHSQLGGDAIDRAFRPRTASEDFSDFLSQRPGSFLLVGNGEGAGLHSPSYDFNDAAVAPAATYWALLVEAALSPQRAATR